jgi:hypothetical protein
MALKGVKEASEQLEKRRKAAQEGSRRWLRIQDGDEVRVRFLEQGDDFTLVKVHSVERQLSNGKSFYADIPCLDPKGGSSEECPGCARSNVNRDDARRRDKFYINVIWRDAPKFQRDAENKIVRDGRGEPIVEGYEDAIAVWSGGITVAEDLDVLDAKYRGLMSRDFAISRTGAGLKTKYTFSIPVDEEGDPVNGGKATPLTEDDKKLAENKYDLSELTVPPDADTFFDGPGGSSGGGDSEAPRDSNPFKNRNRDKE